jgi:hypothetical protein
MRQSQDSKHGGETSAGSQPSQWCVFLFVARSRERGFIFSAKPDSENAFNDEVHG